MQSFRKDFFLKGRAHESGTHPGSSGGLTHPTRWTPLHSCRNKTAGSRTMETRTFVLFSVFSSSFRLLKTTPKHQGQRAGYFSTSYASIICPVTRRLMPLLLLLHRFSTARRCAEKKSRLGEWKLYLRWSAAKEKTARRTRSHGTEEKRGKKNVVLLAFSDSCEGPALCLSLSLSPPIQPAPPLVTSNGVAWATAPHVADGEMVEGGRGRFWCPGSSVRGRKTGQKAKERDKGRAFGNEILEVFVNTSKKD